MRRAIAVSALGLGTTSPNPPVGCVILNTAARVVGEGFHRRKGEAHAEGNALVAAGRAARGGTAAVTLEPCNHEGRAPACRGLLIEAGIARVVVALIDPTSRGDGGVAELRRAGVDVEVGVLADEAELVLRPWLTALQRGAPFVTWAYCADTEDRPQVPGLDVRGYDAVFGWDGELREGTPGGHGDTFVLPGELPQGDPETMLRALYSAGVRSLLLHGGHGLGKLCAAAGLVDEVLVHLPGRAPSSLGGELAPDGFRVTAVRRTGGGLLVQARR
ncbi:bifunctional diaminohydroxyphosphoribosylaminopyrimidine deaminase/5-amino-6-(5-phosphoribosylamino)uracil reductase RibD [Nonomuraea ceibae]|uniref:bifunctional diaminohydroxyphosphoribosylaminopyrimidine deaminase/5-amino-6-(5-phosphoribosylamino)uracil reductase RibD n=1 Tax=Nonomuraea ceibae TaxID=1935170 RepID=UPI001C5DDF55|nr:bifunctional diaminohydroxyphosphoribosylaminopyrimidine deaminase/5-amino-6-(5-phosphoribosylamino)uracil reductase RibD [Nonomuraea ceibae]